MPVTNNPTPVIEQAPEVEVQAPVTELPTGNPVQVTEPQQTSKENVRGLTAAELADPNSISVEIADTNAPLVILFGPPSCGKTMTLVRLTRFLQSKRYQISPIRSFRPSYDTNYSEICEKFDETINSDDAAESTKRISFMLVEVLKNGHRICQILEAPGEYYFDPAKPKADFPTYVNTIISRPNRKVWAIMIEPDWKDMQDRRNYVTKVTNLKSSMRPKDKTVFVYNKIDKTSFVRTIGDVNVSAAIQQVKFDYPNVFDAFINKHPISRFWRAYNCDFVPFQTGTYTETVNKVKYQEGAPEYCTKLWNCILKQIRG